VKLNLGCGQTRLDGYLNVDKSPVCQPDQVMDLEALPWPFATSSVDEVLARHVMEHLGATTDVYLAIWQEIYRVCRPGARVVVVVPHPRHDSFLVDPTHVRPILPESLAMFSKTRNQDWKNRGVSNTPLGFYLDVDFEVTAVQQRLDPFWQQQVDAGQITEAEVLATARLYCNVVQEITILLEVRKS
jgi:SAM-dependent methyltransferase